MFRDKFKLWREEVRAPFFTATIVPIVLGAVIAWVRVGTFHWGFFLLTLIGGLCLHAGTNVVNDYFDHLSGNDEINVEFVRPFTGGSRMIQKGLLQPQEVLRGALAFFAAGSLIGLYLAYARGPIILILGLMGVFCGFFYTAPPVYLARWGIGEFIVGVNFGLLMTLGSYYVQTRALAWEPVVAAIPVALLIAGVLYINEFQDVPADQA
ncbi:MAG: prenyltransferase, partial [Anaerolineae bacterium]